MQKNNQIIVRLNGGLGNQIFQYAFGYAISKKTNRKLILDATLFKKNDLRDYELGGFNLKQCEVIYNKKDMPIVNNNKLYAKIYNLFSFNSCCYLYQEKHFHYDDDVFYQKGAVLYNGYWQSERYFEDYKTEIRDIILKIKLKDRLSDKYFELINGSESVSVHVRRGDYVNNKVTNSVHGVCKISYYSEAFNYVSNLKPSAKFFIFSDDIIWAKKNLGHLADNITFVEHDESTTPQKNMRLMSLCKSQIIANSTFSWWGAWFNCNLDKIVVAPKKWFSDSSNIDTKDLYPKSWVFK